MECASWPQREVREEVKLAQMVHKEQFAVAPVPVFRACPGKDKCPGPCRTFWKARLHGGRECRRKGCGLKADMFCHDEAHQPDDSFFDRHYRIHGHGRKRSAAQKYDAE